MWGPLTGQGETNVHQRFRDRRNPGNAKGAAEKPAPSYYEDQTREEGWPEQEDDPQTKGRANKKAEVIALMKRAKGATLDEIMKATGCQPHTIRGFVSILGSKGGEKIGGSGGGYAWICCHWKRVVTPTDN
jgi:hypothetical protein